MTSQSAASPAAPADQATVRRSNLALVLGRLREAGPRSRADLATETKLNKATVSSLVAELTTRGLVRETGVRSDGAVGRPARILAVDGATVGTLGLEANADYIAAHGTDLAGRVLVNRRDSVDLMGASADKALDRLTSLAADALDAMAAAGARVAGLGIAIPGLVDAADGTVLFAPNLGWCNVPVAARLASALQLDPAITVLVDNDANLSALAEYRLGSEAGTTDLVYLTGEVGVGGGVLVDGRLLRGSAGFGGEVGHMAVDPASGVLCGCGRIGCWETKVGLAALVRQAMPDSPYRVGAPVRDPEDRVAEVLERAQAGDARTLNTLEEIGRWLGIGASILVNIVNPKVIVLGGYFVPLWLYLVDAAERELARHAIAPAGAAGLAGVFGSVNGAGEGVRRVRMVPSTLGFTAAVRGGAAVAIDAVFADPTRVDGDRSRVDTSAHHQESEVAV